MSQGGEQNSDPSELVNGLASGAAILCAFLGYSHGGWVGAIIAAFMAFGGVWLAFHAISLAWRIILMSAVLLMILAALFNRWHWLMGLLEPSKGPLQ